MLLELAQGGLAESLGGAATEGRQPGAEGRKIGGVQAEIMLMKTKKIVQFIWGSAIIALGAIFLTGCFGGMRQGYSGPALQRQQVALLKLPPKRSLFSKEVQEDFYPLNDLMLVSVDGHTSVATEMETLLPGQHKLVFTTGVTLQASFWNLAYRTNDVNLEAGKSYVAVPHFVRTDNDGHPIKDEVQAIPQRKGFGAPWGDTWYYKWWVTVTEENKMP